MKQPPSSAAAAGLGGQIQLSRAAASCASPGEQARVRAGATATAKPRTFCSFFSILLIFLGSLSTGTAAALSELLRFPPATRHMQCTLFSARKAQPLCRELLCIFLLPLLFQGSRGTTLGNK